ncbi:MAG: hypothetical protein ACRDK3_14465 [Actinomycetota bacterium]
MIDSATASRRGIGKRFWVTWSICYGVMLTLIGIAWLLDPTNEDATAGLADPSLNQTLPPRLGFVLLPTIIPLVLGAVRMTRIQDPGSAAHLVIPGLLSLMLVVATWFDSFLPDDVGCNQAGLERFGPLDPECTTALATRVLALGELTLAWIAFALVAVVTHRMRRRKATTAVGRGT